MWCTFTHLSNFLNVPPKVVLFSQYVLEQVPVYKLGTNEGGTQTVKLKQVCSDVVVMIMTRSTHVALRYSSV